MKQWKETLMISSFLLVAGIVLTQLLDFERLTSMFFTLLFPVTGLLWLTSLPKKWKFQEWLALSLCVLSSVHVIINLFVMGGTFSFGYFKKLIMFLMTVLYLHAINNIKITKRHADYIVKITDFLCFALIVMFFVQGEQRNVINGVISSYLTFKFTNPNLLALFLSCFIMIEMTAVLIEKQWKHRLMHLLLAAILMVFVMQTRARNAQLVLAVFGAAYLAAICNRKEKVRLSKCFSVLMGSFPFAFFALYMLLIENPAVQGVFGFLSGVGKALSSRLKIWIPAWNHFVSSPVFGAYYQISDGTGMSQMHNTHLDVAASYGLVVLILLCVLLMQLVYQKGKIYHRKAQLAAMIGFCGSIMLGMGEAAFFSGGLGIYVLMSELLILSLSEQQEILTSDTGFRNVVFLSNYYNHHQHALSSALSHLRKTFRFVATSKMPSERKELGWSEGHHPKYVLHEDKQPKSCKRMIRNADVIIAGSAPESLIQSCIKENKLVFRYSERPLKNGVEPLKYIGRLIKWNLNNPPEKPVYLLCASAYAQSDYAKFGIFKDRAFKWGYFPETKKYDISGLLDVKKKNEILWAGRFLDWKHPEYALKAASILKSEGYLFTLRMIGEGNMKSQLLDEVSKLNLNDCVQICDSMSPNQIREVMEQIGIFLFTSDCKEGWGAVVNEAMNSGCAVIASAEAGSVPYLIEHNTNGLIYENNDVESMVQHLKTLLENPLLQNRLGLEAYRTIVDTWNAESAAERFLCLVDAIVQGQNPLMLYESGPCSPAALSKKNEGTL